MLTTVSNFVSRRQLRLFAAAGRGAFLSELCKDRGGRGSVYTRQALVIEQFVPQLLDYIDHWYDERHTLQSRFDYLSDYRF